MTATAETQNLPSLIVWRYLGYSVVAMFVMIVAIQIGDRWFLNFMHVMSGVLWTGIDLFMGFIIGPILRRIPISLRREIILRLVPKTLFLMPTLSIITGTTGYFLARNLGYLELNWPEFGWVAAAFGLLALLTIQGLGYLLPTNLRVCFELRKSHPDADKINRLVKSFFFVVACQGTMQVLMIIIMARFVSGL